MFGKNEQFLGKINNFWEKWTIFWKNEQFGENEQYLIKFRQRQVRLCDYKVYNSTVKCAICKYKLGLFG